MIDLFYPPKIEELSMAEPSVVHKIDDDPDEDIVLSAYEKKLQQMRKRYYERKLGIPGMSRAQIAKAGAYARNKRREQQRIERGVRGES